MCGRYVLISKLEKIEKRFNVKANDNSKYKTNINISIGEAAPIITSSNPQHLQFFNFGFTPSWSAKQNYLICARSEGDLNKADAPNYMGAKGILQKPMFKHAIRQQRCLIVADAFIEGSKNEGLSKPYIIYAKKQNNPFAMGGIWSSWTNPNSGQSINTFAIITTSANSLMQKIGHHRAPLIIAQENEQAWLDNDTKLSDISLLMQTFDSKHYNAYPISKQIKQSKNKDPQLLAPIGQRIIPEFEYEIYKELALQGMGQTRSRIRKQANEGTQGSLF